VAVGLLVLAVSLLFALPAAQSAPQRSVPGTQLALGSAHSCVLNQAGTVRCWGALTRPFGGVSFVDSLVPITIRHLGRVITLAAGGGYTCALTSARGVKCWGSNMNGALGNGTTMNSAKPVDVTGLTSGVEAIAAGGSFSCALLDGGAVDCWGHNPFGQLGTGTEVDSSVPVGVHGLSEGVSAIAAGGQHACALMQTGAVECWGANYYGELGSGSTEPDESSLPVQVLNLPEAATAVYVAGAHNCARMTSGTLECWGANDYGELGNATLGSSPIPVAVVGLPADVVTLALGADHSCALLSTGNVACWGANEVGQLGTGTSANSSHPLTVRRVMGVTAIAAGDAHTCATLSNGSIRCWGSNSNGQLGNGDSSPSLLPVAVCRPDRCIVPSLTGRMLRSAQRILRADGFAMGEITRASSSRVSKGRVVSQIPLARASLQVGGRIDLVVGRGRG
jgi:alpha-tubulin suppressor-like RCC1 family protein